MKIPITDILLEMRHQKVEQHNPRLEKAAFGLIGTMWGKPKLWDKAVRMVALGRVLGGFKGEITSMPAPINGWTDYRDVAVPPKKSFRQWWETDEARDLLAAERKRGVPGRDSEANKTDFVDPNTGEDK